jgi:hypothetical protein
MLFHGADSLDEKMLPRAVTRQWGRTAGSIAADSVFSTNLAQTPQIIFPLTKKAVPLMGGTAYGLMTNSLRGTGY